MWKGAAIVALLLSATEAQAQSDLDRIPALSNGDESIKASVLPPGDHIYFQGALTLSSPQGNLVVPLPGTAEPDWEARLFADARVVWSLGESTSLHYSGRLNLRAEDGLPFPDHEDIRHDLREAYISWSNSGGVFLEAGRINLKSGVALGFNPTDYFKPRTAVEPTSEDPTALREDRLGTIMLKGQIILPAGSLMVSVAPKLSDQTPPYPNNALPVLDPMIDRTNNTTSSLVKITVNLSDDLNPEFLVFKAAGRTHFGLNVTEGVGQAVVAYLEWSGGNRASLASDALEDGRRLNLLPAVLPLSVSSARGFSNDLALGASYATKLGINLDLEYDYHQAGFSGSNWDEFFTVGSSANSNPAITGPLWFIRGYAGDQQEPMARNGIFVRADCEDLLVSQLDLAGFVDTDLRDGSGLAQVSADYHLSSSWSVGVLADLYFGSKRSNFGSLPQSANVLFKLSRYL